MQTFSAYVINYNYASTIERAIRSIAEQNIPLQEFIVHDDCSTDNSLEIITRLQQEFPQIQIVVPEKNSGVIASERRCIAHCTGDWIVSVSSDDALVPGVLHKVRQMAEQYPDAGYIFGDVIYCNSEGHPTMMSNHARYCTPGYYSPQRYLQDVLMHVTAFFSPGAGTIWRRVPFMDNGVYHTEMESYCDTFKAYVMSQCYGCCYLGEPTHHVTVAEHTYSQRRHGLWKEQMKVYTAVLQRMRSPEYRLLFPEDFVKKWRCSYLTRAAENWLKARIPGLKSLTSMTRQLATGQRDTATVPQKFR